MSVLSLNKDFDSFGAVSGGGINKAVNRLALANNQYWTVNNVIPTPQGFSNKNIGVEKQNTNNLSNNKIQCLFVFGDYLCYIKGGNFYKLPVLGGTESLISSSVFDSTAKIRYAYGRGGSPRIDKVYLCDGVNTPRFWAYSRTKILTGIKL